MKEPQLLQTKAYDYLINLIKKGELETDKIYSLNQLAKEAGFSKLHFVMLYCVLNRNVISIFFQAEALLSIKCPKKILLKHIR